MGKKDPKTFDKRSQRIQRVLNFDPSDLFHRTKIDPHKRTQSLKSKELFPPQEGICSCGCGEKLTGRRTRWASKDCSMFATDVWAILSGYRNQINFYLLRLLEYQCERCDATTDLKIDHIIPVKHGGGGCWLDNFQYLCHSCHVQKTNEDFGWKGKEKIYKS
jgi:hypothetical protein